MTSELGGGANEVLPINSVRANVHLLFSILLHVLTD